MRIHFHIWKYYSSRHRICRMCGEPQEWENETLLGWYIQDFEEWAKNYPKQLQKDNQNKEAERKENDRSKKWHNEQKIKGKNFLSSKFQITRKEQRSNEN